MTHIQIVDELNRRTRNAVIGIPYGPIYRKVLKIIVTQLFIDGLISYVPKPGESLMIAGSVKETTINISFEK